MPSIYTLFAISFLCRTTVQQKCDNSICNHEAVCILKNEEPICSCVGKFFEGEFCSKPSDHCVPNPCQNGGTCQPYLGHYYCECGASYTAQTCTSRQDAFKGLHLHYNHIVPLGKEQPLVLTVQYLGTVETLMDFYTPDYIIDGVAFTASGDQFKPSNDLRALSKGLGIRNSDTLPYNEGFYRIARATFWKAGTHTMVLDLSDFGLSEEKFFTEHFDILVHDPSGMQCLPVVYLPHCSNPRKALHMDIVRFNFVEPIVGERCSQDSHMRIRWSVRNYIDTVVLHTFPDDGSSVLAIPPYTMWFNYRDDYVQSFLIQGDVTELNLSGSVVSNTVLRCYVFVDSKPTTARILGGSFREVNVDKDFFVDGSISRDYARRSGSDQLLQYSWSCLSRDVSNSYCSRNMGNGARLSIPAGSLKLDTSYKFSLLVRSTINIYSTHRSTQEIRAISQDSLLVHFHCLRNCEHDKFAAGKVIHLRLECIECPLGDAAYSVRNEQGSEIANSHSVVLSGDLKQEVHLKAEATLGSLKGTAYLKLIRNSPPVNGNCEVSPKSGTEYHTIFRISCSGYVDDENPIDYKYTAGTTTLDHSGNSTLITRLFQTAGENCEIKVSICDDIGACTEVQLHAKLDPISSQGSWLGLLSNLKQLVDNGDRSAAIVLIRAVVPHVPFGEIFQVAEHIVNSLRDLRLSRLLAVEQVLAVCSNLLKFVELSSESALLVSELVSQSSDGLIHSIRNREVDDLLLETHVQMAGDLMQSMAITAEQVEEFPMVHDAESVPPESPFLENYPDYGELDVADVVRISNWLRSFDRMHRCLQVMGVVSAFLQLPDETPVIGKTAGITSTTLVIEKSQPLSVELNESTTFVSLTDKFLKALNGGEIAIQVLIFEANPFWWSPEQHMVNTDVLSIGAYTKDLQSLNPTSSKEAFSFIMTIKGSTDENFTTGTVNSSLDMPVYERLLPMHAVLVVTFLPLESDIQILLMTGERPRSYMLKDATKIRASRAATTIVLVNRDTAERSAFLAITSESRTEYAFAMHVRMCLTWNTTIHEWTSRHCSVGNQTNATHIHCMCRHLSMFASKVHPTFGRLQTSRGIVHDLPFNRDMTLFYLVTTIVLGSLLWLAWRRDRTAAAGLAVLNCKPGTNACHKYLVTIYTNGQAAASTTGNVTIQLHGSLSDSEQCTLYSTKGGRLFQRNFQTSFELWLAKSLGALHSISLNVDTFGRYPTWNCHMVRVQDKYNRSEYVFIVDKWFVDSDEIVISLSKRRDLQKRGSIFKDTLADAFANWYTQQTVWPFRMYAHLTATEKTAILIVRVCITLVGTLTAFGPTTMLTYEDERETYYSMLMDGRRLLLIASCCHLVGVVVALALQYLFIKLQSSRIAGVMK